jgi:D-alanine-D-alanine ligase
MSKLTIAVFFGSKSFEHDISILTGLEVCQMLDFDRFDVIPIYIDIKNNMWTGEQLLKPTFYPLNKRKKRLLTKISVLVGEEKPTLRATKVGIIFSKSKNINFDVAFLALHGEYGENGMIQGMCELGGIPYTGCRALPSGVAMDKVISKTIAKSVGVPVLDDIVIRRKTNGEFFDIDKLTDAVEFPFPVIVKPTSLGSSVGVSKANNKDELNASVLEVFALGEDAMVEPFIENLEEYNVSVTKAFGGKTTPSVIERPIRKGASFLGFVEKYLSNGTKGGSKSGGSKLGFSPARTGFISMTREFNPTGLGATQSVQLKEWAIKVFDAIGCNGVVRVDFLSNSKNGEFYFGELNTIPGSMSYYLWEASEPSYSYTDLLSSLVDEAIELNKSKKGDNINQAEL